MEQKWHFDYLNARRQAINKWLFTEITGSIISNNKHIQEHPGRLTDSLQTDKSPKQQKHPNQTKYKENCKGEKISWNNLEIVVCMALKGTEMQCQIIELIIKASEGCSLSSKSGFLTNCHRHKTVWKTNTPESLFLFFLYTSYSQLLPTYSPISFHLAVFKKVKHCCPLPCLKGLKKRKLLA